MLYLSVPGLYTATVAISSRRQVRMMRRSDVFPRMAGEGFDAFALTYVGRAFRMLVIVPHDGRFAEVEARRYAGASEAVSLWSR